MNPLSSNMHYHSVFNKKSQKINYEKDFNLLPFGSNYRNQY